MTDSTRCRVGAETPDWPFSTRETVGADTPASRAICATVSFGDFPGGSGPVIAAV
ncbi:hypothetical protein GCM10027569_37380 [Flindersiella endophytica]